MHDPRFDWATAVLDEDLCESVVELRDADVAAFRALMGYPPRRRASLQSRRPAWG